MRSSERAPPLLRQIEEVVEFIESKLQELDAEKAELAAFQVWGGLVWGVCTRVHACVRVCVRACVCVCVCSAL